MEDRFAEEWQRTGEFAEEIELIRQLPDDIDFGEAVRIRAEWGILLPGIGCTNLPRRPACSRRPQELN